MDDVKIGAPGMIRLRKQQHGDDRGDDHDTGKNTEQRSAAHGGHEVGNRAEENDREDAKRQTDDGEEPVRIGAAADRAMGDRERRCRQRAGQRMAQGHDPETGLASRRMPKATRGQAEAQCRDKLAG